MSGQGTKRAAPNIIEITKKTNIDNGLDIGKGLVLRDFPIAERINTIKDGKRVLVLGPSGCGKSTAALAILRACSNIPYCVVLSPSEGRNHTFGPHVHDLTIHEDFEPEEMVKILEGVKERQKQKCKKWEIKGSKNPILYTQDPSAIVVLDDCQIAKEAFKKPIFRWIFFNSRHDKIIVIMMSQYFMQIPSEHRSNASHVFIFHQDGIKEIKKLYEEFGVFDSFADFKHAHDVITSVKGRAMVIDKTGMGGNHISDKVFYCHAPEQSPPFQVGTSWSTESMDMYYNQDWSEESLQKVSQQKVDIQWQKEEQERSSAPPPSKRQKTSGPISVTLVDNMGNIIVGSDQPM